MALNEAYFDAIHIDVVKKKYYNANKVEAVLADIRRQALALQEENELLYRQIEALNGQKDDIGDALLSAKSISRQMIQDAQQQAAQIVAQAEERRDELEAESARRQQELVAQVEGCYLHMRDRLTTCVEDIGADWQDFLCGLSEEESGAPADLGDKVDAIAKELFSLDEK